MTAQFVAERAERRRPVRSLLRRLVPRDRRFEPLFGAQAGLCVEAVEALAALLADVSDPHGRVRDIEALEKRGDRVVDETRALLRRALFPPFPRAAIHGLINRLDDVLDLTEDAAQSLHLYHVTVVTADAQRLADLAVSATRKLRQAVDALCATDDPRQALALCDEVDELEAQADHVMRAAMSRLFREEPDARQLVKLRSIYEVLEELTDKCKHAAADIESLAVR
jgi:predicted phosphate transport protein (TIGR00153 family)